MTRPLIWLTLALCLSNTARADAAAQMLMNRYQQALRAHDAATLETLIEDGVAIEVTWTDVNPPQRFTLSKSEYLQQSRAAWRYGTQESYTFTAVDWQPGAGGAPLQGQLRVTERRTLFGKDSGQRSDLVVKLAPGGEGWKINGIRATVSMW